jgi:purine/pyrimidine-nucleoside phosphorylase
MKHSVYFDGKVQSLSINTLDGYATVGVMESGKYTFSTVKEETMVITAGILNAKLPGKDWAVFKQGARFVAAPNASFDVEAEGEVAYICYYK